MVEKSDVYGREAEQEEIMELLIKNEESGQNVVVIPILGMGGIGKTTLAQLIFEDRRVDERFELKAWVWVSEWFDATRVIDDILKKMIKTSTSGTKAPNDYLDDILKKMINASTSGTKEPDEALKDALKERTFLLVLDNVWNIEYSEWKKLLLPLKGAEQVKIVVTTRNDGVVKAMQIGIIHPYPLEKMSYKDCWKLFARDAFSGINSNSLSDLEEFGREIVLKCKGVPLAVTTLGCLLHTVQDPEEWEKISKSSMWALVNEKIQPALTLSYYYLPCHLKRCFAFCAIFPKGYEFQKEELISLWMAQGFLITPGSDGMEKIGVKYFDDLVSRSLFQHQKKPSWYTSVYFSMHDLIYDLAEYVSEEFCFKFDEDGKSCFGLEGEKSYTLHERTRYLSFTPRHDRVLKVLERIHEVPHLRTLLPLQRFQWEELDDKVLDCIFVKRLRMLSLFGYNRYILPDAICKLMHLRHLDLSSSSIERLPEDVCTLHNLQTLILKQCRNLIELPTKMSKLVNLQQLDIEETPLKAMPSKMGELRKLRKLTDFFVAKQSGSSIKELGKLLHLQESLSIWNLQNVADVQDALDANLESKKQIKKLFLNWDGNTDDTQREREVLEKLKPSINVERLDIIGYGGTRFPNWVGNSFFSNMVWLRLAGCKNCTFLPPLGQLPSLEGLWIEGFDEVVTVGLEFYGSDPLMERPFKSLKALTFTKMPKWIEWNTDVVGAFPLLEKLRMEKCPKFVGSFPAAPKLTEFNLNHWWSWEDGSFLRVREGSLLKGFKRGSGVVLSSITEVEIEGCRSLKSCQLDFLPHLSKFIIADCPDLESLCINEGPLLSLRELILLNCTNLKSLPENMHSLLPSLEELFLSNLPQVDSFPKFPSTLTSLYIYELENLKSLDCTGALRELSLNNCTNLKSLPENMHSLLPSLEELFLCNLPQVDSFPKFPSTLTSLCIGNLENLKSLDCTGRQHLTSLCTLMICDCPLLEIIPEESLPSSIENLEIIKVKDLDCMGLQYLTSLRELKIRECSNLESVPEEGLSSSLEYLEIGDLKNLKSLNYKGLQYLNSLRQLNIEECFKLESLPEEGLPSSLQSLQIRTCPLLAKRCERETGEDWPKISHIPHITIE